MWQWLETYESGVTATNPSPCSLGTIDPNIRPAIVGEWNIGIERAITSTIALDVNYAGSHGEWGQGALDVNQPIPGVKADELQRRPYYGQFPYLSQVFVEGANDPSNYNALQTRLTKTRVAGADSDRRLHLEPQFDHSWAGRSGQSEERDG